MNKPYQQINNYRPGYDELKKVLRELKANLNALKAFVMIVPYPITMWNSEGQLMFANDEAIEFLKIDVSLIRKVFWKDQIFNQIGMPDPQSIIENKNDIIIPALLESKGQNPSKFSNNLKNIETIVSPISDTNNSTQIILVTHIDKSNIIDERVKNKQLIKELKETRITLKNVLKIAEQEIRNGQEEVVNEVKNKILPFIQRLSMKKIIKTDDINEIESVFVRISKKYKQDILPIGYSFTPTEIKVCEMLHSGFSGKEVAKALNVTYATIHSHMNNIRKKLNISGTKTNLQTFLIENYG